MALAGALRAYRGVNETISTLLLNYIAIALLNHLVEGPLRDPASLNKPSTLPIGDDNMLGTLPGPRRPLGPRRGASARACLAWVLMQRTTFGFAARMVGRQRPRGAAERPAGAAADRDRDVPRRAGAPALAGAVEVAAIHGTANASLVTGYGYTGVLVAFIARAQPAGRHPGGDPARRHRRQRRPAAARLRAARRDRERAARDPLPRRSCCRRRSTGAAGVRAARRRPA